MQLYFSHGYNKKLNVVVVKSIVYPHRVIVANVSNAPDKYTFSHQFFHFLIRTPGAEKKNQE